MSICDEHVAWLEFLTHSSCVEHLGFTFSGDISHGCLPAVCPGTVPGMCSSRDAPTFGEGWGGRCVSVGWLLMSVGSAASLAGL